MQPKGITQLSRAAVLAVIPGKGTVAGVRLPEPTPGRRKESQAGGRRSRQPAPLPDILRAPPRSRCPGPRQKPAGLEGAPPAAPLTLSLVLSVSWSPPAASPSRGGGATAPPGPGQPPRCLSSNIIRSRAAAAASSNAPKPEPRAGSRRRPRTGRSEEPLTPRQHGAAAAAAPGHPQNGSNERALEAASSERGAGGGAASGCGAGSGRLARAELAGTRRSAAAGCQVRACTQRPQVGGAQGRGAREGA